MSGRCSEERPAPCNAEPAMSTSLVALVTSTRCRLPPSRVGRRRRSRGERGGCSAGRDDHAVDAGAKRYLTDRLQRGLCRWLRNGPRRLPADGRGLGRRWLRPASTWGCCRVSILEGGSPLQSGRSAVTGRTDDLGIPAPVYAEFICFEPRRHGRPPRLRDVSHRAPDETRVAPLNMRGALDLLATSRRCAP